MELSSCIVIVVFLRDGSFRSTITRNPFDGVVVDLNGEGVCVDGHNWKKSQ